MTRHFHMWLDVRGALANWSDREFRGAFKHDDGRAMTAREAKEALMDEIAQGHRVIPIGDCPDFDFQTGCPGHVDSAPDVDLLATASLTRPPESSAPGTAGTPDTEPRHSGSAPKGVTS